MNVAYIIEILPAVTDQFVNCLRESLKKETKGKYDLVLYYEEGKKLYKLERITNQ